MAAISLKPKENTEVDERRQVQDWRRFVLKDELIKAGLEEVTADDVEVLVHLDNISWEDIKDLREKDCPPDLILKILS